VFGTDRGRPRDQDSIRERVLVPVVNRVNEIRRERGIALLPKIKPHALRRTYISLMLEAGAPLPYVMDLVRDDILAALEFGALAVGRRRIVPLSAA
jgi:integrase